MKFSIVASVATFFAGAIAAPHGASAGVAVEHAKRTSLTPLVNNLKTAVTDTIAVTQKISNGIINTTGDDLETAADIAVRILDLNSTMDAVDAALTALGLATLETAVDGAAADFEGVVYSARTVVSNIIEGLRNTTTALVDGTSATLTSAADTAALAATDFTTVLDKLAAAASISTEIEQLVSSVSDTLATINAAIKAGTLGTITSTTSASDISTALQTITTMVSYLAERIAKL